MVKWADHDITAVRYNDEGTHIVKVKAFADLDDGLGPSKEWARRQVVSAIEAGTTFVTAFKTEQGKWKRGQDVHIVVVNNEKYIRTDQNQTAQDNLAKLPKF